MTDEKNTDEPRPTGLQMLSTTIGTVCAVVAVLLLGAGLFGVQQLNGCNELTCVFAEGLMQIGFVGGCVALMAGLVLILAGRPSRNSSVK
jgi:hypothetical protein